MTRSIEWLSRGAQDAEVGVYIPSQSASNLYVEGDEVLWDLSSPKYTILKFGDINTAGWTSGNIMRATLVVDIHERGDAITVYPLASTASSWTAATSWGSGALEVDEDDVDVQNPFHQLITEDSSGPQFVDITKHVIDAAAGTTPHYGFFFKCWATDAGRGMDWYVKVEFSSLGFSTVTVKQGTFGSTEDTWMASSDLTPHGLDADLHVDRLNGSGVRERTFIKFTGWESSIPAERTIRSATLRLYVIDTWSSTNPFQVHELQDGAGFVEATDNESVWKDRTGVPYVFHPSAVRYYGRYGYSVSEDTGNSLLPAAAVGAWAEADLVVPYRKFQCGEVANNGHVIVPRFASSNDGAEFASAQNATAANRPELVIEYSND